MMFDNCEDAVFIADAALRIIEANPAGLGLCGYRADEIAGIKLSAIIHPEDLDSCPFLADERTAETNEQFECRARILKKDKTAVNAELFFDAISDGLYTLTAAISNNAEPAARFDPDKNIMKRVMRKTVDSLPLWISCVDPEGRYIFANEYYSSTFKIPLENIEGHNFKEFFPPALYEKHKRLLDKCIKSRMTVTFEDDADLGNGVKVVLYGVYTPFFTEDKTVSRISVAAFDITAKKELELQAEKTAEALRASEEKYRSLVDNAICGIGVAKGDKIVYANKTLMDIYGCDDFSEFSAKRLTYYHTPESVKLIRDWRERKARGERVPNEFEVDIIRKDGQIRTLLIKIANITINDEILSQTTFIDVTEKNKIENDLKELTARYEYIVDASGMAAYDYNAETGEMLWGNASIKKMLGYKTEELSEKVEHWIEILHPEDRDEVVRRLKEAEAGDSLLDYEYRIRHKDGHYAWIRDRGFFQRDGAGRAIRHLGIMEDITDRKKAGDELICSLEEAEAASRAKNLFLANISHEIRTPMNGIIGFTNLMGTFGLNDEQREYNDIIKTSCAHLLGLIDDILDFSKLESKKLELENRPFDIKEILNNSINLIAEHARLKKLEIETHVDKAICYKVSGDELRVRQILINLLTNAVKFTFKGKIGTGISQVSINDEIATISIEVYDTGIGFPSEKADEIFEIFHQLDESSTKRHVGAGIGLSIVKRLVEMMGGAINAASEPGKGSRFKVVLPFKISYGEDEVHEKTNHNEKVSAENGTVKVLLAEDDSISRALVEAICYKNGWDISTAGNGFETFEMYKKEKYDVVLMDGRMPEMDGFEATSRIREFEKKSGRRVPIMAITAYALEGDREKFIAAGADDYITKPIESDEIFTGKILGLLNKNTGEKA
jgi:PAS domain S-box-containing protein